MKNDTQNDKKFSQKTMERVNIAKSYIEKKYSLKKFKEEEKKKGNSSLFRMGSIQSKTRTNEYISQRERLNKKRRSSQRSRISPHAVNKPNLDVKKFQ
jgi:hypothetical protein